MYIGVYRCILVYIGVSVYQCADGNRCIDVSVCARCSVYRCIGVSGRRTLRGPQSQTLCISCNIFKNLVDIPGYFFLKGWNNPGASAKSIMSGGGVGRVPKYAYRKVGLVWEV